MKKIFAFIVAVIFSITAQAGTSLKFATEATYPPFVYMNPAGDVIGFDADIVRALCQQMQANCMLLNQPWESLIPSLKLGKFDAIFGGVAITPEREKQVAFTQPYYQLTGSVVANKSLHLALSAQGVKGKTFGVQEGTTYDTYLQTVYGNNITINRYPSAQQALMDLASGRVDAVMGDTPVIQQWVKENGKNQFALVGQPINDEKYFGKGDAIAVRLGNTQLLNALNKALTTIKANGTYCKIVHKNFGNVACHG